MTGKYKRPEPSSLRKKREKIDPGKEGFWPNTKELIDHGSITPLISNHISSELIFDGKFRESVVDKWSKDVEYPWGARPYITSVAQYARIRKSPKAARSDYLSYLKSALIEKAYEDDEVVSPGQYEIAYENQTNSSYSFTQMARDLGYVDFKSEALSQHPLALLARLPIKVYVTTGYHQFLELALEQVGKEPDSQVFPWQKEYYEDSVEEPEILKPLVFHLFGRDDQPDSLVLTENDHLDLLVKFIRVSMVTHTGDKTNFDGKRIEQGLPRIVRDALFQTNRLLLGYGVRSWDFRVLFRGLLTRQQQGPDSDTGLFIQFMRELAGDGHEIEEILNTYFLDRSKLRVKWCTPQKTLMQLHEIWRPGGLSNGSATGGNGHG